MGYIVTGIDVLAWVMLSAGTIAIPLMVFLICCVKKQWKHQKKITTYYEKQKLHVTGMVGPYAGSQDNLNKKQPFKPVISAPHPIQPPPPAPPQLPLFNEKNVRFKDDNATNERRLNSYIQNPSMGASNISASAGLPSLSLPIIEPNVANELQQPTLAERFIDSNQIYSLATPLHQQPPSASYRQQQSIYEAKPINLQEYDQNENIYSHVLTQQPIVHPRSMPHHPTQHQYEYDDEVNIENENEQPIYMNAAPFQLASSSSTNNSNRLVIHDHDDPSSTYENYSQQPIHVNNNQMNRWNDNAV